MVKLIFEEKVLNIVLVYASKVECQEKNKEVFWREMGEVMQVIPSNEDTNGHECDVNGYEWICR